MKITKWILIVPVLIVTVLLVLLSITNKSLLSKYLYSLSYHKPQNLEFSVKPCSQDISGYDMDKMGVKEAIWKDYSTISVKVYMTTYCAGAKILYPNYKIENNNLILEYTVVRENPISKCLCARELNYTISGLSKNNYNPVLNGKML